MPTKRKPTGEEILAEAIAEINQVDLMVRFGVQQPECLIGAWHWISAQIEGAALHVIWEEDTTGDYCDHWITSTKDQPNE